MAAIRGGSQRFAKVEELTVCSLASGSNGNIYYIEYHGEAVVVDMGISFRRLKNRAQTCHIDLRKIKAVLVSHEHSDHVYGLSALCRQTGAVAYMTRGTYDGMRDKYRPEQSSVRLFSIGERLTVGPFSVHSFAKPHDVLEPCSFRIEAGGVSVGVFTDIGAPCPGLDESLCQCHAAFLESNYDPAMLRDGRYPEHLKRRIVSGCGHLSNDQAAETVRRLRPQKLHTIFLSHISQDNNRPDIALKAFEDLTGLYTVKVMSRHEASDIWRITPEGSACVPPVIEIPRRLDRVPLTVC